MKTNLETPRWIHYDSEECPNCAERNAQVYTTNPTEGLVNDGDKACCINCSHDGHVSVEDSECADIVWDSLDGEDDEDEE